MATTHLPAFDEPIDPKLDLEALRAELKEGMREAQGDSDKADEVNSVCWYDGQVSVYIHVLSRLTGQDPEKNYL